MKRKLSIAVVLLCVLFVGCASLGIKLDTKEKQYLAARSELNLLLEFYISVQDQIPDADHQKAKTAFIAADGALDAWEIIVIGGGEPSAGNLMQWMQAKTIIMEVLRGIYGRT